MNKTGYADSPLHGGKAPAWLFSRMKVLAREIICYIASEFESDYILNRLSDPFWFQSFGCVLGFDWHSSGLTTTTCAAIKEGIKELSHDLGLFAAGGKGKTSLKTPREIKAQAEREGLAENNLVFASKMSAKVDSSAVQDGYQLYHHSFFFTAKGNWTVVQQGMNEVSKTARRYHWQSRKVQDFVIQPHTAICSQKLNPNVLDMTAKESGNCRSTTAGLACQAPEKTIKEIENTALSMPKSHFIKPEDINPRHIQKTLLKTYEKQPGNFAQLLQIKGVGPKTIRALACVSELIYGQPPSFKDPARYSFAHGGKDGIPYPVNKQTYDQTIEFLEKALKASKIGQAEKIKAFRRLANIQ